MDRGTDSCNRRRRGGPIASKTATVVDRALNANVGRNEIHTRCASTKSSLTVSPRPGSSPIWISPSMIRKGGS